MDEKTKREWNELQNELAELQKTVDEYENWIKTEGAELEDMYAQLQFLNKSEDDEVPEHPFRLPEADWCPSRSWSEGKKHPR